MNQDERYQALVEELALRSCVLFVGAGLSIGAGLPGWAELLEKLDQRLHTRLGPVRGDFLDYAEKIDLNVGRVRKVEALREILRAPGIEPSPVHRALLSLPFRAIFTTNYDDLIERTLEQAGRRYDSIRYDEEVGVIDEHEAVPVIKFHGDLEDPPGVVLTRRDYMLYHDLHPAFTPLFEAMLATRTFLFVGFGLADDNFKELDKTVQRALGRYRRKAYAIVVRNDPRDTLSIPNFEILGVPLERIHHFIEKLVRDVRGLSQGSFSSLERVSRSARRGIEKELGELPESLYLYEDQRPSRPPKDHVAAAVKKRIYRLLQEMERFRYADDGAWRKLGMAFFKMRDYRAALRAYAHVSLQDDAAARILARCHWYLGEKWRTRRILDGWIYPDPRNENLINLQYLIHWPGDVTFFAHTCNWEASEHLERRRYHRTLALSRRGLRVLSAWMEKRPEVPGEYQWIWRYIYNHTGRSHLLQIQAGAPIDAHWRAAESSLEKAIEVGGEGFPEAWSNLLDLYKFAGDQGAIERLKQRAFATRDASLIQRLSAWHHDQDWSSREAPDELVSGHGHARDRSKTSPAPRERNGSISGKTK